MQVKIIIKRTVLKVNKKAQKELLNIDSKNHLPLLTQFSDLLKVKRSTVVSDFINPFKPYVSFL